MLVYACVDDMCVFSIFYVYACTRAGTHVPVVCDREIQSSIRRRTAVWMTRRLASAEVIHSFAQGGGHIDESRDESIVIGRSVGRSLGRSVEGRGRSPPARPGRGMSPRGWLVGVPSTGEMHEGTRARVGRRRAGVARAHTHARASSRMKRLFGAKRAVAPARTLEETAQSLDARAKTIDGKIAALDRELVKHREAIKRTRPGAAQEAAKRRALVVLKQKKMYEQQRDQLGGQLMNVEQVAFASENAKDTVETVRAMQSASKELKTTFKAKEFDLEKIDALNDDMADLLDLGEEIQETLGRSYNVPDGLDEDDLLDELDALELDMLEEEAELTDGVPSYLQDEALPEAPEEEPVVLPEAGAVAAETPGQETAPAVRDTA